MTASQMRIAETIAAFYGVAGTNDGVSRSYKQAVDDLYARGDLDNRVEEVLQDIRDLSIAGTV